MGSIINTLLFIVLFILFFAFFTLLFWTIFTIFFPNKVNLERRLQGYSRQKKNSQEQQAEETNISKNPLIQKGHKLTAKVTKNRRIVEALEDLLQKAGLPVKASEFIFFHILAVLFFSMFGLIISRGRLSIALIFILVGTFGPISYLYIKKSQYSRKFHFQLPDTLDLIAGSLKAGYSFLQSLNMVVEETSPPIKEEFQKVILETRLGLSIDKALDNLTQRVESESLDWTMMAVKIQKEVGGNLAEVLETLAYTIRERERMTRQIKVLTAEGRLSAIILFALPFLLALVLAFVNPGYLANLYNNILGWAIISISVLLMVVGGVWLKKIVSIEV